MFGQGMVPKENFLTHSTQFVFFMKRLVPGDVGMVAINILGESPV